MSDSSDEDYEYSNMIQHHLNSVINKNKDRLNGVQKSKIRGSYTYANSLNLYVGAQGNGKTGAIIKELIKISLNDPNTHLLIYINKTGEPHDEFFEISKEMIECPIVYVSHKDAQLMLEDLFEYKSYYKQIKGNNIPDDEIPQSVQNELYKKLYINDFSRPTLHTLLFFEDTVKSPLLKNNFIIQMLSQCRHYGISAFLAVQFWKALSPELKENSATVSFYGGSNRKVLAYFMSQISVAQTYHDIVNQYMKLLPSDRMLVDNVIQTVKFIDRDH